MRSRSTRIKGGLQQLYPTADRRDMTRLIAFALLWFISLPAGAAGLASLLHRKPNYTKQQNKRRPKWGISERDYRKALARGKNPRTKPAHGRPNHKPQRVR